MSAAPAGIPEADWLATPASVRTLILAQQQEASHAVVLDAISNLKPLALFDTIGDTIHRYRTLPSSFTLIKLTVLCPRRPIILTTTMGLARIFHCGVKGYAMPCS